MKKKLLVAMLTAVMVLTSACGQAQSTGNEGSESGSAVEESVATEESTEAEGSSEVQESAEASESSEAQEEITFEVAGLAEFYQDSFPIGVAIPNSVLHNISKYEDVILNNFTQITCENETKPDYILDKTASQADLENTYLHAAVKFNNCASAIRFAQENNLQLRIHPLVWHSQTPGWFFTEDYTDNGELASREVMLARMENYIADVINYFDENYPGLVYAVDVVNEAFDVGDGDENGIRMKNNKWYETVGPDYYYQAFVFARKYAPEYMTLYYNDYGCMDKVDLILGHLQQAKDEGLIDGIGMQGHLSTTDRIEHKFILAAKNFCKAGYQVQVTELDIGISEDTESAYLTQGRKYCVLFKKLQDLKAEGYPINGVTVWGISDDLSWRNGENPLMFDVKLQPKKAYLGAMQHSSIPPVE